MSCASGMALSLLECLGVLLMTGVFESFSVATAKSLPPILEFQQGLLLVGFPLRRHLQLESGGDQRPDGPDLVSRLIGADSVYPRRFAIRRRMARSSLFSRKPEAAQDGERRNGRRIEAAGRQGFGQRGGILSLGQLGRIYDGWFDKR